jgi:ribA/ribD-fused uncharacterized protein
MVEVEIIHDNMKFKSVEAFYQAMKTDVLELRIPFQKLSGPESKKLGRKLTIRNNWESIKDNVMEYGLRQKFSKPEFISLLLNTSNREIIEGNYWHDNYWGSCTCDKCGNKGLNKLGILLMKIRKELQDNDVF